jgi:hypothetical protein
MGHGIGQYRRGNAMLMFMPMMACIRTVMMAMFLAMPRDDKVTMVFFTTPLVGVAQCGRKNPPSHHKK